MVLAPAMMAIAVVIIAIAVKSIGDIIVQVFAPFTNFFAAVVYLRPLVRGCVIVAMTPILT
jgi:hypothetical protein